MKKDFEKLIINFEKSATNLRKEGESFFNVGLYDESKKKIIEQGVYTLASDCIRKILKRHEKS